MCAVLVKSAMLLFTLNYLGCSANSNELVKLRACCNLNLQSGPQSCGNETNDTISEHPIIANSTASVATASDEGTVWEVPSNLMSTISVTKFLLSPQELQCSGGRGNISSFPLNIDAVGSNITFYPSGYLLYQMAGSFRTAGDFFHTTQYCINGVTNTSVEILTCKRHCTPMEPCIPRCCSPDTVYTKLDLTLPGNCTDPGPMKWTPRVFSSPNKQLSENELAQIQPWYTLNPPHIWRKKCRSKTIHILFFDEGAANAIHVNESTSFRLQQDGNILLWNTLARNWEMFKNTEDGFCLDGIVYESKPYYTNKEEETYLLTCPVHLEPPKKRDASFFYGVFASSTCIFALITVVVYGLLWEKQNVHGWTIMSHSTSVFFFFVFIATAQFTKNDKTVRTTSACLVVATMTHYFFLSTFCWLTMISLDLWMTFGSMSVTKAKGLKRFAAFSAFGWGVPLFIVCLSWALEFVFKDEKFSEFPVPMYGEYTCYLTKNAFWMYIYAPCTILITLNLIFFGLTTWKLYQIKKTTRFATQSVQKDHQSYLLFVKLFFVAGVLWIFEIISYIVDSTDSKWYWQAFDSLNCLSPVTIFFIFIFKYELIKSLGMKYPVMKILCLPNMWLLGLWRNRKSPRNQNAAGSGTQMNNVEPNTASTKVSEFVALTRVPG